MPKSAADRNRASRYRSKVKKGTIKPEERAWLSQYESDVQKSRRDNPPVPPKRKASEPKPTSPEPQRVEQHRVEQPSPETPNPTPREPVMSAPASAARANVQSGYVSIPFANGPPDSGFGPAPSNEVSTGTSLVPLGAPAPDPKCDIPDCPACRAEQAGGQICAATGKRVWPPMTMESATAMAEGLLMIVGLIARILRRDKFAPEPNKYEIQMLATGIREVQMRRASWIGAADDLMMVATGLGGYTRRAFKEKKPEEKTEERDGNE